MATKQVFAWLILNNKPIYFAYNAYNFRIGSILPERNSLRFASDPLSDVAIGMRSIYFIDTVLCWAKKEHYDETTDGIGTGTRSAFPAGNDT